MDERNPSESKAIESSLWEIASLQLHSLSQISVAAKLIFANASKNKTENDLSQILELNENDVSFYFPLLLIHDFFNYKFLHFRCLIK